MLGLSQQLQEKWAPVLEHGDLPAIEDNYKKAVTSILLENLYATDITLISIYSQKMKPFRH